VVSNQGFVSIVDDELDITILFRDALRSVAGVSVFTFTDPELALEYFKTNSTAYVLVLTDFRMPGLDGMQLIKKIKELNPLVRTILMTAYEVDDVVFKEYVKKEIINGFLQKPIRLDNMREVNNQLRYFESRK
jgi:two-component system response regulator (stage 0 sporulation protein F)